MANTSSAKKAIRSSARKNKFNSIIKRKLKDSRKEVLGSVNAKDKKEATKKLADAMKQIDKAAKSKTIHQRTAARYKSRLAKAIAKVE